MPGAISTSRARYLRTTRTPRPSSTASSAFTIRTSTLRATCVSTFSGQTGSRRSRYNWSLRASCISFCSRTPTIRSTRTRPRSWQSIPRTLPETCSGPCRAGRSTASSLTVWLATRSDTARANQTLSRLLQRTC